MTTFSDILLTILSDTANGKPASPDAFLRLRDEQHSLIGRSGYQTPHDFELIYDELKMCEAHAIDCADHALDNAERYSPESLAETPEDKGDRMHDERRDANLEYQD